MSGMRMKKRPTMDYQEIVSDPESPFKVTLVNDDINHWEVKFIGPSDTYYEGLLFRLSVVFPDNYPIGIPTIRFLSKVYHPNVFTDGSICLDTIKREKYSPAMKMEGILMGVVSLLSDPNLNSPANGDACRDWEEPNIKSIVQKRHKA